ncbi:unnamed protein product, partial [Symbiodinium pilosum]
APSQLIVGGYSQGAASALQSVLEYPERLAGCIALSGWVLPRAHDALRVGAVNCGARYYLYHGRRDVQVSLNCSKHARQLLSEAGAQVDFVAGSAGHAP